MATLVTIYWLTFGIGLVYVLVVGALGLIGSGIEAIGGDTDLDMDHGGVDFDANPDLDLDTDLDVDTDFDVDVDTDLDLDVDTDVDFDADAGGHADFGGGHGDVSAGHDPGHAGLFPTFNPFSPLSIAGFLTAFGGAGLIASNSELAVWLSILVAAGGGLLMSLLLWLVIGKFFYGMQGSSEAHQADMIGLEAEVLTPMDQDEMGEIAYVLDGVRFTAPARLTKEGHTERREKVRIRRMKDNVVYVEQKHKLLN